MSCSSDPEMRKDPVVDRWVLIAPERAKRPGDLPVALFPELPNGCPFCEGREDQTPSEVFAIRPGSANANGPGWRVRVVPNMYPAVSAPSPAASGEDGDRRPAQGGGVGEVEFVSLPAVGIHEVIVECPQHESSLTVMPVEHIATILATWRDRMLQIRENREAVYVQVFKNHGPAAGASLEHAHSQLIGLPRIPSVIQAELDAVERHKGQFGGCLFCDLIEREQSAGERLIRSTDRFTAFTAFAGRFPYETWIFPRQHNGRFEETSRAQIQGLAELLRWFLGRLDQCADRPSYNLLLHTAPFIGATADYFHWHFEFLPRLTGVAGFEWGTGCFVNPIVPEKAAEILRQVK